MRQTRFSGLARYHFGVVRDWEVYYSDPANVDLAPAPPLVQVAGLLKPGRALDLACGTGRNALHLARLGWEVTAVDSSSAAIGILRREAAGLAVDARVADLERGAFDIPPESYDLICDFFYLQRDLFPAIREGLRLGGVFAAAIHLRGEGAAGGPRNPAFLLEPGELRGHFVGWKILFYSEAPEDSGRRTARILARRA